jgi:hypothetical protein
MKKKEHSIFFFFIHYQSGIMLVGKENKYRAYERQNLSRVTLFNPLNKSYGLINSLNMDDS